MAELNRSPIMMKTLLLFILLPFAGFGAPTSFDPIADAEVVLGDSKGLVITTRGQALSALLDAVYAQISASAALSATSSCGLRDVVTLPADFGEIGKKGDVIWIGDWSAQSGLHIKPDAIFFINARTGVAVGIGDRIKNKANQRLQGTPESVPSSSTEPEARRP